MCACMRTGGQGRHVSLQAPLTCVPPASSFPRSSPPPTLHVSPARFVHAFFFHFFFANLLRWQGIGVGRGPVSGAVCVSIPLVREGTRMPVMH
jgi:hypothetical protein